MGHRFHPALAVITILYVLSTPVLSAQAANAAVGPQTAWPVLRKLSSKEVASMTTNTTWKHPPSTTEYTSQEIADIVGFVRWASTGSTKVVKLEDVEETK